MVILVTLDFQHYLKSDVFHRTNKHNSRACLLILQLLFALVGLHSEDANPHTLVFLRNLPLSLYFS
jgi:hypothetical membrane protein